MCWLCVCFSWLAAWEFQRGEGTKADSDGEGHGAGLRLIYCTMWPTQSLAREFPCHVGLLRLSAALARRTARWAPPTFLVALPTHTYISK